MKKILLLILIVLSNATLFGGRGGAVAGGVLGGLALGSLITAASRPREVVYVQQQPAAPAYNYDRVDYRNDYVRRLEEENRQLRSQIDDNLDF